MTDKNNHTEQEETYIIPSPSTGCTHVYNFVVTMLMNQKAEELILNAFEYVIKSSL